MHRDASDSCIMQSCEPAPAAARCYAFRKLKLGDVWAGVSWLLQQPDAVLCERTRRRRSLPVRPLVEEIVALLDVGRSLQIVPGSAGGALPEMECYRWNYLPTRERWRANESKVICVQWDGIWKSHLKNPTPEEKERFHRAMGEAGCEIVVIGRPMTLTECVYALATCRCFVGVDSGMMHVAHSVGCPRILVRNRMFQIDEVYEGKSLIVTGILDDALKLLLG